MAPTNFDGSCSQIGPCEG